MKIITTIARKYRFIILAYLVMGLTQAFLSTFGSRYYQTIIDNFTRGNLSAASIAIYGAAMIALYLVCYLSEYPGRTLEHGITLSLKIAALKKTSVMDYLAYAKLGTGALIQRIENGAAAGGNMLFGYYLRIIGNLLPEMLFSIAFIFAISRAVTLFILAGYLVVFLVTNLLLKALYKVKSSILINEERLNHYLVRGFMEMVVFRVNRRFAHEIRKAESASEEIVAAKVKMTLIHEAFFTIFAVLVGCVKIGIIAYGWTTKSLTIGAIVALCALIDNAYTPIAIFNVLYVQYKLDKVAFGRYAEFLTAKDDPRLTSGNEVAEIRGDIAFCGVDFSYDEREIFRNFQLVIEPGQATAFVGESGSGKSTAAKLLAGLLHPQAGRITVDGRDLAGINLDSYYAHIAYLPQEPPIFNGTLRENLVFDEAINDAALLDVIEGVGLKPLYEHLPDGLNTQLGERGVILSGGERQMLALARLWLSPASVVILDEATSAIDNLSEEAIMRTMLARLKGRTVIAIAHRLDAIRAFDDICVFQDGKVVERGCFDTLIAKQGVFYALYTRNENR